MIQVSHLTKMYGPRPAVQDLNFSVKRGEIVGFLGPNGAGKTTTMSILTGFMPASVGTASVAGFDVFEKPLEVKKRVGYLPENPPVYRDLTVTDYLEFCARIKNVPKDKLQAAVDLVVEKLALGEVRGRIIGNLSKGFRQRVGLAQALVHNPEVLILDEPTVGLDPKQIIDIRSVIKGFAGDHTIILSSHILPEVTATCQRVIVINQGKIVAQDTIENLTSRMTEGQIYTLEVKNTNGGVDALKKISGVKDVRLSGSRFEVEIDKGAGEIRDKIVEAAVKENMGVLTFSADKLSLEDVFLQLTTKEAAQ